jgi:PST family polysaccharide transporter
MKHLLVHARRGLVMIAGNLGNFAFTLARNKLLALFLGPIGVGWIGLVNTLVEVGTNLAGAGVSDALGRELARKQPEFSPAQIVETGLGLVLIGLGLVLPVMIGLFVWLVPPIGTSALVLPGFVLAVLSATAWRYFGGIYLGQGRARVIFNTLVWAGAFNCAVTGLLLLAGWRDPLGFVLLSYVPMALFSAAGLGPLRAHVVAVQRAWQMPAWRPMLAIALPVVIGTPLETVLVLVVRSATAQRLGAVALGQIQPGLTFVILAASLFNAFVGITTSRWDQSGERAFSPASRLLLAAAIAVPVLGVPLLAVTAPLWTLAVRLLFSAAFVPGAAAVPWFLGGEAFHLGGLLLFSTLFSRARGYLTLVPRLGALAALALALALGMDRSVVQIGQCYAVAFVAYFALALAVWVTVQIGFWRAERASLH